ncbi:hypothetical protein Tco_1370577 [Tanacetum coccineum]
MFMAWASDDGTRNGGTRYGMVGGAVGWADAMAQLLLSAVEVNAASYDFYYCWFKLQLLVGVTAAAQD